MYIFKIFRTGTYVIKKKCTSVTSKFFKILEEGGKGFKCLLPINIEKNLLYDIVIVLVHHVKPQKYLKTNFDLKKNLL